MFVNRCSRLVFFPDIDRNSPTCQCNGVSTATDIPEEGLILYPVALRDPTGHGDIRGNNDVELKSTLLSHPLATEHSSGDAGLLPHHFQPKPSRNLEGRLNPRRVEHQLEDLHVFQPVRTVRSEIVESDEKR